MMMTLRRLAVLAARADGMGGMFAENLAAFGAALDQRAVERGPSKLARRLRRKRHLGMAGAF